MQWKEVFVPVELVKLKGFGVGGGLVKMSCREAGSRLKLR
jgi:hypothetical protein